MDLAYKNGKMVGSMKECIKIIKKMVMEYTHGRMEEFTMVNGKMVYNMDMDIIKIKMRMSFQLVDGKMDTV